MVAKFKEMRLPFSTKPTTATATTATTQTDRSRPSAPKQSKTTKSFGKPQTVPERSPVLKTPTPTPAISLKQRPFRSSVNMNSPSPTRPPGLGLKKATPPVHKPSAPRAAAKTPHSVSSPIRSSRQKASAEPSTSPYNRTSTGADLASVSVVSAPAQVDVDEPILFVSCFHSLEEDPEEEEDLLQAAELTSDFESQVAQIFGVGLGDVSENEVAKPGEIAPPMATPETTLAPSLEYMSAVVEWWEPEPTVSPAIEFDVPMAVKSKGRTDEVENTPSEQNQIVCVPSTHMDMPSPLLATSVVRPFDMGLPKMVPYQPLSSIDFEYVSSLGQGPFGSIALCIHKQSRRQCTIKIISNIILEEQRIVRAVLAEQRIMREASGHPLLLGLLASFHDVQGFHLVSVSLSFPMLSDSHRPISGVLSLYSIRRALSYARVLQEARVRRIGEPPPICSETRMLTQDLQACAVNHLHKLGIIHRDIKLENVMLKNDGRVVLGNFDLAVRLEAPAAAPRPGGSVRVGKGNALKARGVCGTLPYMAPEVLRNMEYSYGVDWFAYGVFLHIFYLDKVRFYFLQ